MPIDGLGSKYNLADTIKKEGTGQADLYREDFLRMLIEQIKNQDPLSPMENTEFTTQLAQFSALEGITNLNETMNTMLLTQASLNNASSMTLIGKEIKFEGNTFNLTDQPETLYYSLPYQAKKSYISIYDSNDSEVKKILLPIASNTEGMHTIEWDGTDNQNKPVTTGTYTFKVRATDTFEEKMDASEYSVGVVNDLIFDEMGTYLLVNDRKVSVSDVIKVSLDENL